MNKVIFILSVSLLFFSYAWAESPIKEKLIVSVTIPETSETEYQELKNHQTGLVKVFLSSLGDMVDSYMISLVDLTGSSKTVNLLTDSDGVVTFKKVPAGNYAVHINRKAATEDQEHSTVKISDIIIRAYP